MRTSIYICVLISFACSQELKNYGDTLVNFYEFQNKNNIQLSHMRSEIYKANKVYPFLDKIDLFDQNAEDNFYGLEVSYKGKDGFYIHTAIIPFEGDKAYLFTIPGIPTTVYPSRSSDCYETKIMEKWSNIKDFCYVEVSVSKQLNEQFDKAFENKYMSISDYSGHNDTSFQFKRYNKGLVDAFHITFNDKSMVRFASIFNEYKNLYSLIKKELIKIGPQCTRKNVLSNIEKECGVSWRSE